MSPIRLFAVVATLGLVVVACTGGTANEADAPPNGELTATVADQVAQIEELQAQLTAAQAEIETIGEGRADLVAESEEALAAAEAASKEAAAQVVALQSELAALRLAFDEELVAARTEFAAQFPSLACAWQKENPIQKAAVADVAIRVAQGNPQWELAIEGVDVGTFADVAGIEALLEQCRAEGKAEADAAAAVAQAEAAAAAAEAEAAELQEQLTANKPDGFFTIGREIAPGRWESQGSGDDCYWARLDSNQDILDNHFGPAGGTVRIRSSDYEVQFEGCGFWVYQGN